MCYVLSAYISIICSHISILFLNNTIKNTVKWNDMKDFSMPPFFIKWTGTWHKIERTLAIIIVFIERVFGNSKTFIWCDNCLNFMLIYTIQTTDGHNSFYMSHPIWAHNKTVLMVNSNIKLVRFWFSVTIWPDTCMRQTVWFGGLLNAVHLVKRRPFSPTLQKHARAIMQQFLKVLKW